MCHVKFKRCESENKVFIEKNNILLRQNNEYDYYGINNNVFGHGNGWNSYSDVDGNTDKGR